MKLFDQSVGKRVRLFGTRQTNLVFQDEVGAPFETELRDFGCNVCEAATSRAISRGFENIGDCRHSLRC